MVVTNFSQDCTLTVQITCRTNDSRSAEILPGRWKRVCCFDSTIGRATIYCNGHGQDCVVSWSEL